MKIKDFKAIAITPDNGTRKGESRRSVDLEKSANKKDETTFLAFSPFIFSVLFFRFLKRFNASKNYSSLLSSLLLPRKVPKKSEEVFL